MWLTGSSRPTGAANDSRQSLRSVDRRSYLAFEPTNCGRSSNAESVWTHSRLSPMRTSAGSNCISEIGTLFESESAKYCSNSPSCSGVPSRSLALRRDSVIWPPSLIIASNWLTASMKRAIVSVSVASRGISRPRHSVEKLLWARETSREVLVMNRKHECVRCGRSLKCSS